MGLLQGRLQSTLSQIGHIHTNTLIILFTVAIILDDSREFQNRSKGIFNKKTPDPKLPDWEIWAQ